MTLNDPKPRFQGHRVTTDALDILCAQLTRDLFAIAKFIVFIPLHLTHPLGGGSRLVLKKKLEWCGYPTMKKV